jgi:hypothetical protein
LVRISFDMDGVLADMETALAAIAEQEFGVAIRHTALKEEPASVAAGATAAPPAGTSAAHSHQEPSSAAVLASLSSRQQTRLWERVATTRNFWETLEEHEPGTVQHLQKLALELRWDVIFVTQRPATSGRTIQLQTQRWLRRHGFEFPSVYTTQASRGRIAAALTLDAHVDDRLEHCVDVSTDSKAWPILVWRDAESFGRIASGAKKINIAVVPTVREAIDHVEEADRGGAAQKSTRSLLERLKRSFGR